MSNALKELRKRYWEPRPPGERRTLLLGAAVLTPLLFYALLWQPAHDAADKLHAKLPALRVQAAKLREQAAEVEAVRHRPQPAQLEIAALKSAIEESATRHQLRPALSMIEVHPPNAVHIASESIAFEPWLKWLRELQNEQQIRADSISITALPQSGLVKLNATLVNGSQP